MADHSTSVDLFYDGAWNDAPVYTRDGITISRGAPSEGQDSPPSTASLTLDNRTGDHNPRNPTGALYGLAGRNTPMRVVSDGSTRSTTEAASWAPQRSLDGNDAWTSVEGGGILRRLQQGSTPLRSPAVRGQLAENPLAYWPLEDGQGSTQAASGLIGGTPLALTGTQGFARGDGLLGSPKLLDMAQGTGLLMATVAGSGTGWGVEFGFRMPTEESSLPAVANFMRIRASGTAAIWDFFANVDMNAFPQRADETTIGGVAGTGASGPVFDGQWHFAQLDVEDDGGGGVDATWYLDGVSMGTTNFASVTPGHVTSVALNYTNFFATGGTPNYSDMPVLGYLAVYDGTTPNTTTDAGLGYPGETAGARFLRLGTEEGITTVVDGTSADTQAMGPQPADTFVNLLRECCRSDGGALMYEPRDQLAVAMRPNRDLYNQSSALDLSFIGGVIAPNLQPILDDRGTRNDVTVKRRDGSSARATKTTGALNTSDPVDDPEGVGRFDTSIDVNTETDDVLYGHATWWLHKGTVDEPRYPQITVDLDSPNATAALITSVNAVEIGDRITVTNMPVDWSPDGASLLVVGVRESLPPKRRLVTFVTVPASPYEVAIVGDGSAFSIDLRGQAIDSDSWTLGSSLTSTGTSVSLASSGLLMTTTSSDWNTSNHGGGLYLVLGGEVVRVTNVTGASSPQTVTVVRSINGVVKAHASGTSVHVRYPAVVGL